MMSFHYSSLIIAIKNLIVEGGQNCILLIIHKDV